MSDIGARAGTVAPTRTGPVETLRVLSEVLMPAIAVGVVKRRPRAMALAERLQVDRAAIRLLQRLRERHGQGPLRLGIAGRTIAVPLDAADVARVLDQTPEPFATDTFEKRAALAKFQPHGVLLSHGAVRGERRRFNEAALETDRPLHHLAGPMRAVIDEEMGPPARGSRLAWGEMETAWWRIVRRVVFGDAARDDTELVAALASLRRGANWAYLSPKRARVRRELHERLRAHLERAQAGSLAAVIADLRPGERIRPEDQVAHWLFAFDAAGITLPRALALLAVHPRHRDTAVHEASSGAGRGAEELPFVRGCVLEALRLWPTTPLLLRESTAETAWGDRALPAGTTFAIYTPLFHRDGQRLPYADDFAPEIWADGTASAAHGLVPFSAGPARCPGRDLALFCVAGALARLLSESGPRLASAAPLYTGRPAPATLDPFGLAFTRTPIRTRPRAYPGPGAGSRATRRTHTT